MTSPGISAINPAVLDLAASGGSVPGSKKASQAAMIKQQVDPIPRVADPNEINLPDGVGRIRRQGDLKWTISSSADLNPH